MKRDDWVTLSRARMKHDGENHAQTTSHRCAPKMIGHSQLQLRIDEAFFLLGDVFRAQERFEEAAEWFREAIKIDPEYRSAREALRDAERCLKSLKRRL